MGQNALTYIFANAMQVFQYCHSNWDTNLTYHKKVKDHPSLIILTNLVDFESLMLYTKIQPQSFLSTREEDF